MLGHYDMILGMNTRKRHLVLRLQLLILFVFFLSPYSAQLLYPL